PARGAADRRRPRPGSEGAPAEVRGDPEDSLGGRAGDLAVLQRRDLRDQRPAAQLRGATRLLRAAARGWYRVAAVRAYLLRRLWQSAVTLVGVSILVFVILRVVPGDPAKMLLPEGAPPSAVEELNRHLGLREPLWVQYEIFLRSVVRGDFGQSFQYRAPALRVVIERVPATIALACSRSSARSTSARGAPRGWASGAWSCATRSAMPRSRC